MSNHSQSDEPQKINIELNIRITFPMTTRVNNIEYFAEMKEESSLILSILKDLRITDYKLRYCLLVNGELGEYPNRRIQSAQFLMPGSPGWTEIGNFIVQISTDISAILPDAAALVNILTPIVKGIFTLLHLGKKKQDAIGVPYIALGIDNHFVEVGGPDQKKNEEDANRIMDDMLKKYPSASGDRKIDMRTKYFGAPRNRRKRQNKVRR